MAGLVWLFTGCSGPPHDALHRANEVALAHLESGRYPDAVTAFQDAVAKWPEERTLWVNLAQALVLANRRAEAMAAYESALELPDESPKAKAGRTGHDHLLLDYAVTAIGVRRTPRALAFLEAITGPEPSSARSAIAFAILQRVEGRLGDALQSAEKATELWKTDGDSSGDEGSWGDIGLLARAIRMSGVVARDGLEADIDHDLDALGREDLIPAVMIRVSISLLQAGRSEEALVWARRATEAAPEIGRSWHLQALALEALGRSDEAIPVLQQASKARFPDPEAVVHYAAEMLERGLEEEALSVLRDLSSTPTRPGGPESDSAVVQMAIGSVYAQRGQRLLAREHVERALQIDPYNPEAALLYEKLTGSPPPPKVTQEPGE